MLKLAAEKISLPKKMNSNDLLRLVDEMIISERKIQANLISHIAEVDFRPAYKTLGYGRFFV